MQVFESEPTFTVIDDVPALPVAAIALTVTEFVPAEADEIRGAAGAPPTTVAVAVIVAIS